MAAGLERDSVVILRMDGEDLQQFVSGIQFEAEAKRIFSEVREAEGLHDCICKALVKLTVDDGMPPPSDPWVHSNIVDPAMQVDEYEGEQAPISQETFLEAFKKVVQNVVVRLRVQPVIVAHSGSTFDGSGIKTILSSKPELDKVLGSTWGSLPKDQGGRLSMEYLRVALDVIAPEIGLPTQGAVAQMDAITCQVFKTVKADQGATINQEEFNKVLLEIISKIMLQLEAKPVTVSSNAVVNEPISSTSVSPLE